MSTLPEQLRARAAWLESRSIAQLSGTLEREAADEIERLTMNLQAFEGGQSLDAYWMKKHGEEAAALRQQLASAPRWMDRPNAPGLWLCIRDPLWAPSCPMKLTQEALDRGEPFSTIRAYGPIPEEPKTLLTTRAGA